jgi:hypothetical protein
MSKLTKNLKKVLTRQEVKELITDNEKAIRKLYIDNDLTAKEIANMYKSEYSDYWNKELYRQLGTKNKGHGGKRTGSGNKKGFNQYKKKEL